MTSEKKINTAVHKLQKREAWIQKLEQLLEINSLIASSLSKETVLQNILNHSKHILEAEKTSVLLVDEKINRLVFAIFSDQKDKEPLTDIHLKMGEGIAGSVWKSGQRIFISDASMDERF